MADRGTQLDSLLLHWHPAPLQTRASGFRSRAALSSTSHAPGCTLDVFQVFVLHADADSCLLPQRVLHNGGGTTHTVKNCGHVDINEECKEELAIPHPDVPPATPRAAQHKRSIMASTCSPPSPCGIECVTPESSSHKYSEGGEPHEGEAGVPPSTCLNPVNIPLREMRSNATAPSMDVTVVWRTGCGRLDTGTHLLGHRACNQTPSDILEHDPLHPTIWFGQCRQPAHADRYLTSGILSEIWCSPRTSDKRGRKCSPVMPEGPAADPFFEDLRFRLSTSSSKSNAHRDTWFRNSGGRSSRGWGGPPGSICDLPQSGLVAWCESCSFQSLSCR